MIYEWNSWICSLLNVQCSYTLLNRGSINLGKTEFSIQVIAGASGLQRAWIISLLLAARRNYCSVRRLLSIKWQADLWLPRHHWTLSKSCFWCLPQTLSCFSYHPQTSSNSISAKQWVNLRYTLLGPLGSVMNHPTVCISRLWKELRTGVLCLLSEDDSCSAASPPVPLPQIAHTFQLKTTDSNSFMWFQ